MWCRTDELSPLGGSSQPSMPIRTPVGYEVHISSAKSPCGASVPHYICSAWDGDPAGMGIAGPFIG